MKKVLILEDNKNTLAYLTQVVKECDNNLIVFSRSTLEDAFADILQNQFDLFIIDVILDTSKPGDTSGLRFAERMRSIKEYRFTPLIFITSLMDSKFISYDEFHCYRFIEKPFAVQRVKETINECLLFPNNLKQDKIMYFHKDGIILSIRTYEIMYVESINHILHIHTIKKDIIKIPYITLSRFMQDVEQLDFVQCSRNTIVNFRFINYIDIPNRIIELNNGERIEIGIRFKNVIKEKMYAATNN